MLSEIFMVGVIKFGAHGGFVVGTAYVWDIYVCFFNFPGPPLRHLKWARIFLGVYSLFYDITLDHLFYIHFEKML